MKQIYLILGINEPTILQSASLSSTGITTEDKCFIVGTLIDKTDSLEYALTVAKDNFNKHEHGIEIRTVYIAAKPEATPSKKKFEEYYKDVIKYQTPEQAASAGKAGQWICKVNLKDGEGFYILHKFDKYQDKHLKSGAIVGMWNEITLITKV